MANQQWVETLYSFRLVPNGVMRVAKWEGGKRPVEVYHVTSEGKGKCDCIGSMRTPYCKHRQMIDKVLGLLEREKLGSVHGCFYDYDHDVLYTPADGEGVPVDMSWIGEVYAKAA